MNGVTREARTLSGEDIGATITYPDGTSGRLRGVVQQPGVTIIRYGSPPTRDTIHPSTPVTIERTTP